MMMRGFAALTVAAMLAFGLPGAAMAKGPESVSSLAAQLSPAVVNISTSRMLGGGGMPFPQGPEGSQLDDMFDDLNPNQEFGPDAMQEARSLGSGFIISPDGTVVTNNHVVEGADEILVFLNDGTRHRAKLLGSDTKADLAVLKIEAGQELPFVEFGDSDGAEVGDWVMAIGNPFGLGGSVTLGIVSARNRDIHSGPYDDFIQTDAAINVGNSGGPLFDMDGKVVGINTAIIAQGGSSLGIGFAVPVNLARPVVQQLAEFGETRRGWLGVSLEDVTDEVAAGRGRTNTHGAMVVDVTETGPADGIVMTGDIILDFNGRPVVKMRDLPRMVAETAVGEHVKVKVLRGDDELTLGVTLGRLEDGEKLMAAAQQEAFPDDLSDVQAPGIREILGLEVEVVDDEAREAFDIAETTRGLVVTDVVAGSDAEQQGLARGLVISEMDQRPVATVDDLIARLDVAKEAGRPVVVLTITNSEGANRYVPVKLG